MYRPDAYSSVGRKRRKRRVAAPRTLRVFHRSCCDTQVKLCSGCDRGQRYCSKACRALIRPAQVRGAGRIYQLRPAGRALHADRQRAYWARRSVAKLASLCNSPALATSSESVLIPPSPRAQRPGPSIPDTNPPNRATHCGYHPTLPAAAYRSSASEIRIFRRWAGHLNMRKG